MKKDSTPVRGLGVLDENGCRILSQPSVRYADGGEARLAEIVARATDLSSTSQEIADEATDWATEYSLTPVRANLLRSMDLPRDARVLEIGAGCGPITRYLGERCALVDAVEPMAARARVARLRTRDQGNVEVFVGMLEDVPVEEAYDLVVVVGVLEYVGEGTADERPYADFLRRIHRLLRPGGSLVLAIENQVGVKYLVGAPEDHSDRAFDSVEDYPLPSPARTFTRRRITEMIEAAGFGVHALGAFPDYKLPQVLLDDSLFEAAPRLARRIPTLPTRDYQSQRLWLANERLVWQTLVDTGLAAHFANSLVMVAGRDGRSPLWPEERMAAYFALGRQPEFGIRTTVEVEAGVPVFRRSRVAPGNVDVSDSDDRVVGGVRHVLAPDAALVPGVTLLEAIAQDPEHAADYLRRWAALVPDAPDAPVDLVPHNVILGDDDRLTVIDQEWHVAGYGRANHVLRGLYWTAVGLGRSVDGARWGGPTTLRELIERLASLIDVSLSDEDLDAFVAAEGAFQSVVNASSLSAVVRAERAAADLRAQLEVPLSDLLGSRLSVRDLATLQARSRELERLQTEIGQLLATLAERETEIAALRRPRTLRGQVLRAARALGVEQPARRAARRIDEIVERVRRP